MTIKGIFTVVATVILIIGGVWATATWPTHDRPRGTVEQRELPYPTRPEVYMVTEVTYDKDTGNNVVTAERIPDGRSFSLIAKPELPLVPGNQACWVSVYTFGSEDKVESFFAPLPDCQESGQ